MSGRRGGMGRQHIYFCEAQNENGKWRRTDHMASTRKKLRIVIDGLGDEWKSEYHSGSEVSNGRKMYRFTRYISVLQVAGWNASKEGEEKGGETG